MRTKQVEIKSDSAGKDNKLQVFFRKEFHFLTFKVRKIRKKYKADGNIPRKFIFNLVIIYAIIDL